MNGLEWVLLVAGIALYVCGVGLVRSALSDGNASRLNQARLTGILAVLVHTLVLVLNTTRTGEFSVGGAFLFLASAITLVALGIDWLRRLPILVVGTMPLALATSLLAVALSFGKADPSENSAAGGVWTAVHVVVALASYSAFAIAFVTGILYLVEQRQLKEHSATSLLGVMPSLETVSKLNARSIAAGVALLAAGLLVGYWQARSVYGVVPDWRHDPKIYLTTLTLLAYGAVLALNARPAFRGRRTAMASVLSFSLVLATFWASIFWSGFHRFH